MSAQDARKEIALLVNSNNPIVYLETWEEDRAVEILGCVAQDLRIPLYVWAVTTGLAMAGGAPIYNTQEPPQVLAEIDGIRTEALFLLKDFHKYLDQDVIVRKLRDLGQYFRRERRSVIISAPIVKIPTELEKDTALFSLGLPDEAEFTQLVQLVLQELIERFRVKNQLSGDRFPELASNLRGLTREEARRVLKQAILENNRLDLSTFDRMREAKAKLIKDQGVIEFTRVESGLGSVGGLARLKAWLAKRHGLLTAEAARYGLEPPKGILIFGVQGCGKSLCAKAVSREWNLPLLRFDTSALFDKYVGESERNLRKSLQVVEAVAPAVLWIDEIEKMFPAAGLGSEADGGLSLRLFGSFISWMQEKKSPVFIVATCNNVASMPPELLRKGRFDELFFVDLPDTEERKSIFTIHLNRHKQAPADFDLAVLAVAAEGFSGAEIEQAVSSALCTAFAQKASLTTEMVLEEIRSTYPLSVTMKEKVESLRAWARERAVPAN
jgi:hypothetical protein